MSFDFDQVIERRGTRSIKWTRYGRDVLPLWVADMDFLAADPVRRALRAAVEHGVYGYEFATTRLKATVAERMQRLYGWRVQPEMVVATPGIVAGFNVAARACGNPGEGIVVQPPVYGPFLALPEQTAMVGQLAPLRERAGARVSYEIDWDVFEKGFNSNGARTAMFLLCNPHNPTGQVYSRPELERMAEICLRQNAVICSDEIHSELLLGGARHVPIAALSEEIADRSITLFSASKTFNVVGLFCGFAIIPNSVLRIRFEKVLHDQAMHVNSFGLIGAEAALGGGCDGWLEEIRQYLTANRDFLVDFVDGQLPGVRTSVPDATYLAWMDFGELIRRGNVATDPYRFLLEKARIALNRGTEFGPGGESFARLNFACPRAVLKEALDRLRAAVL